jgi:hypothetical protein
MRHIHNAPVADSNRESSCRAIIPLLWATASIALSACGGGGGGDMGSVSSGSAVLVWNAVNEPNVTGYRIHYGTEPGQYSQVVDAGNVTTVAVTSLQRSTRYYFAATAYNLSDGSSVFSNEVFKDIP